MRRFAVLVIVVLVLAGGAALWFRFWPELRESRQAAPAPPPAKAEAVAALGRIRPENGIIEVGADATRRVSRLLVREGQVVKKGEILAYLDNYDELQDAAAFAAAQLEGGKNQLAFRTAVEEANIARAEAELDSVKKLAPLGIAMQKLTVEKCRLELELARKEAKRLERLADKGSAARSDLEAKNAEAAQKTIALKSAAAELNRLESAFTIDRAKAQASLDSARANLKLYQAQIDLDSLAKSLQQARGRLNSAVVRAPADGRVLQIRSREGEVVRSSGLLTLANLRTMWVIAEVYENDLLRIREGQSAKITAAALAEPLRGEVKQVGRLISRQTVFDLDPSSASDARVGEVRIRLDRPEPADRLINLQVTVTIEVAGAPPSEEGS